MRKTVWAALLCAALLTAACGGAAEPAKSDRELAKELAASASTEAGKQLEETAETAETVQKAAETAQESAGEAEKDAADPDREKADADRQEKDAAATAEEKETTEADKEPAEPAEDKAEPPVRKAAVDSAGRVIREDDAAQSEEAADESVPEWFNPYGVYLLVYDSGFEVKTRYSQSGLTYYKESEEFFFVLNKDLPNFPGKMAHILFNTAAPMDPSEAAGEVFPFDEHYMIYITLDDGSYYEVSRDQLDLKGRIFIRDLYESFREKWEGAF